MEQKIERLLEYMSYVPDEHTYYPTVNEVIEVCWPDHFTVVDCVEVDGDEFTIILEDGEFITQYDNLDGVNFKIYQVVCEIE